MRRTRLASLPITVAVAVLALGACSGAPPGVARAEMPATIRPAPRAGSPVDVPAMRALLARRSPSGHAILATYESLPQRFVFGRTTITVSHGGRFGDYFTDPAPEHVFADMNTAVHETYHAYASVMGYQLLVERGQAPDPEGVEAVLADGAPVLVPFTVTFPAREMDATYPPDARTSRYATYVSAAPDMQSTQSDGIYGLLDELTAYYQGSRTLVDLWPWIRDEVPPSRTLLVRYAASLHEIWVPRAELTLFILHYLVHARTHHPDVYRAIMDNPGFRAAFAAVDRGYGRLLEAAARLEPEVHAYARASGVAIGLRAGELTFAGAPWNARDAAYPAVVRHLESARYRPLLEELRASPPRR